MEFLTNTDLLTVIDQDVLTAITGSNSARLDDAEAIAAGEVEEHLNTKYDTAAIFAATGNNRNQSIIRIMVDLTLYHAHCNLTPHNVPEVREKRYTKALKDLLLMQKGTLAPKGLPHPEPEEGDDSFPEWGLFSGEKFNSSSSDY